MNQMWIGVLVILILAARQLNAKPMKRSLFVLPIIMFGYGLYFCASSGVQTGEAVSLAIMTVMSLAVGFVQGHLTRVYQHNEVWMIAGSWLSVAVWLFSLPIRFIVKYGFIHLFNIPVVLTGDRMFVPFLFAVARIVLGRAIYFAVKYPDEFMEAASMSRYERRSRRRAYRRY
ncbi:hypothetical protein [Paenibacillus chibensis]|uniref:hypothetical protein n=1 Tax=Paenibacillus chibensis TaxID=59846 RepID=UPI000FDA4ED8|nr:hypothetical protein [Paenibacillus chibensis]MEC0370311.1 hypothetical protein [Paenibacillus chibensis]